MVIHFFYLFSLYHCKWLQGYITHFRCSAWMVYIAFELKIIVSMISKLLYSLMKFSRRPTAHINSIRWINNLPKIQSACDTAHLYANSFDIVAVKRDTFKGSNDRVRVTNGCGAAFRRLQSKQKTLISWKIAVERHCVISCY